MAINFIKKGINTYDATATSNDIAENKTAYVNNKKITGSINNLPAYECTNLWSSEISDTMSLLTNDDLSILNLFNELDLNNGDYAYFVYRRGSTSIAICVADYVEGYSFYNWNNDSYYNYYNHRSNTGSPIKRYFYEKGSWEYVDICHNLAVASSISNIIFSNTDIYKTDGSLYYSPNILNNKVTFNKDILFRKDSNIEIISKFNDISSVIGLTSNKIKQGESVLGIIGSVKELNGQVKTITPSTIEQSIEPDEGYNAITEVTISAVTSTIDSNIQAGNIKKGVTILGVTGTYEGTTEEINS